MFSLASNLPSPEVGYHATLSINFSTFSKKKKTFYKLPLQVSSGTLYSCRYYSTDILLR